MPALLASVLNRPVFITSKAGFDIIKLRLLVKLDSIPFLISIPRRKEKGKGTY